MSQQNCSLRQCSSAIHVCSLLSLFFSSNPTTTIKPTRGEASELVTNSDESTTAEVTALTFSQPQATISNQFVLLQTAIIFN